MNRASETLSALVLALALAGCGGESSGTLTISAAAAAASAPTAGAPAGAAGKLVVAGGRVEVERVRMIIRDIKLEREGMAEEVVASNGPFLLDLSGAALDGGITQLFEVTAPEGSYDDLRFVVHPLEDVQRIGDADLDGTRSSVVLDLVVDGQRVRFTSDLNDQQRLAGTFRIAGGSSSDNITIRIDGSGWFVGSGGAFLDPRVGANRDAIEENLRASIDAFDDDDRDGHDDDGPGHT